MILHIPHASDVIPVHLRDQFVLSDAELEQQKLRLTDAYTDELFHYPEAEIIYFPCSRLVMDVERFADDDQEPMSRVGMGRLYMKTTDGRPLRRALSPAETRELDRLYAEHHQKLTAAVETELNDKGRALIIDCHSFPSAPLPCDRDQTQPRPDFCIGTDGFHTPPEIVDILRESLAEKGFSVEINRPYSGSIVPLTYYGMDRRVSSIMIEINRRLYVDETTGEKLYAFEVIKAGIQSLLGKISELSL